MKYRRKPTVIEAMQVKWSTWGEMCEFCGPINGRNIEESEASDTCGEQAPFIAFEVTTTHGDQATVRHGDWVIPDSKPGTFYPCKPDIFAATYDEVPDA